MLIKKLLVNINHNLYENKLNEISNKNNDLSNKYFSDETGMDKKNIMDIINIKYNKLK